MVNWRRNFLVVVVLVVDRKKKEEKEKHDRSVSELSRGRNARMMYNRRREKEERERERKGGKKIREKSRYLLIVLNQGGGYGLLKHLASNGRFKTSGIFYAHP